MKFIRVKFDAEPDSNEEVVPHTEMFLNVAEICKMEQRGDFCLITLNNGVKISAMHDVYKILEMIDRSKNSFEWIEYYMTEKEDKEVEDILSKKRAEQ